MRPHCRREGRRRPGAEKPAQRVSPRGGRRRGCARHGPGPGGGGASTPERRGAPQPRRAGARTSRHRRGADDRPATGSFVVSADGRANRTFESDPARRRARRPLTLYAESSAVLRWLFEEAGGDEAHRLLRDASKVVCSRLTLVETRRVIRRAVAQKLLDEVSSTAVLEVFAQAGAGWAILELSREVAERAEGSFPVEPVRTLDALHLASTLLLRLALPDLRILSTDDRVRSNGHGLGFEVFPA